MTTDQPPPPPTEDLPVIVSGPPAAAPEPMPTEAQPDSVEEPTPEPPAAPDTVTIILTLSPDKATVAAARQGELPIIRSGPLASRLDLVEAVYAAALDRPFDPVVVKKPKKPAPAVTAAPAAKKPTPSKSAPTNAASTKTKPAKPNKHAGTPVSLFAPDA